MAKPRNGYTFAVRYDKPSDMTVLNYLSDLERTFNAVRGIVENTAMKEKYVRESRGMHVYLAAGSTPDGRYAFARFNTEVRVVSEDPQFTSKIMSRYKGRTVTPVKRLTPGVVNLGSSVHQMMHDLFGKELYVFAKHGEQSRFTI